MDYRSTKATRFALTGVAVATACLWGTHAAALGLGRLNVQSALGESLKAEIEVTSITADEAASLRIRVAPPEAFRTAGVDYNTVLPSAQVQMLKRADGRSVLRLTSDRAVLEPFVDVIIEATWSSGRLVREYTLLFDPPNLRIAQAPGVGVVGVVAGAVIGPAPAMPSPTPTPTPVPVPVPLAPAAPSAPMTRPAPPPRAKALGLAPAPSPVPTPAPAPSSAQAPLAAPSAVGGDTYRVKPGESLSRIAARTQPGGVSLDQMLVSLFRGNPQAFINENINKLKAGSVLTLPSGEQAAKVAPQTAREIIVAQSSDFGAYKQRLAAGATTAPEAVPARQAKGSVQAQVDDRKAASAGTPDRLTLTQGGSQPAAPATNKKDDNKDGKKDDKTRLAELNRNVEELKRLQGATATAPAAATAGQAPVGPTAATPTPAPTTAPTQAPSAAPGVAAAPPVTSPGMPSANSPMANSPIANSPAAAVSPAASRAAAAAAAVAASAPKAEAPGFLDALFDNDLLLPGAGVLVALLAGLGLYKLRGRMRKPAGETSFLESRLQPDSFFGASGGQRIDTRETGAAANAGNSSSMSYSMSQLDAIGDVDPVAEADVYLAYGRDLQAEEILKEAMRATPERMAIRTKLLEVYAKRRDAKAYELLATQVYNLTGGTGEDWAKAQTMGRTIDSDNAMYLPGGAPEGVRSGTGEPRPDALSAPTQPYTAPAAPPTFQPAADATLGSGIDLDLEFDVPAPKPAPPALQASQVSPALTTPIAAAAAGRAPDNLLDFDLSAFGADEVTVPGKPAKPAVPAADHNTLDFGDFDLAAPAVAPSAADPAHAAHSGDGADAVDLARKLELAEAFRQIGDAEGARDLLEEVVAKGQGALKTKAQGMLDKLARG